MSAPDLYLDGLGLTLFHRRFDECHRFLNRLFPPFRSLVNRDMRVVNLTDQLPHGLSGNAPHHVQNGKLDGGQRYADTQATQSEVESKYEGFFHKFIQPPCILVNKERLQTIDEYRDTARSSYREQRKSLPHHPWIAPDTERTFHNAVTRRIL